MRAITKILLMTAASVPYAGRGYAQIGAQPRTPGAQTSATPSTLQAPAAASPTAPATPTANAGASAQISEVVVTAEKHATTSQNTPIALRVVSGAALRSAGVTDVQALTRLAPDLGITTDTIFTKLSLRGVSAETVTEGADAALTVDIDGEYINRPTALNATLYDLDRVEVLKGPQGTLYGRNATAGAINILAAKPTDVFGGYVMAGGGNYGAYNAQGAINIPINSDLAVRFAAIHSEHSGYDNNGPAGYGNNANQSAARGSVLFKHGPLRVYGALEYVNVNQDAPDQFGIPVTATTPGLVSKSGVTAAGVTVTDLIPAGPLGSPMLRQNFPTTAIGYFKSEQVHGRLQVDYDIGHGLTASYIGGYYRNRSPSDIPLSGTPEALQFFAYNPHEDSTDLSNEFHLSYSGPRGLFVQAGAFYFRERQNVEDSTQIANPPFGPPGTTDVYVNYFYRPDIVLNSYSGFAQADVPITNTLKLSAGVRYTDDHKTALYENAGLGFVDPAFGLKTPTMSDIVAAAGGIPTQCGTSTSGGGDTVIDQCYSKSEVNWLAGFEWKPNRGHLIYGKVSTAFRAGGFDNLTRQVVNGEEVGNFAPEKITSYEIGSKNRFFDSRLELNIDAFHYDYSNLQVDSFFDTEVGQYTANAGKAKYNGIEADGVAVITPDDHVHLTVDWLDASFTQFQTVEVGINGNAVPVDLAGNKPAQAPKWVVAAGYEHRWELGSLGSLLGDVDTRYKSSYFLESYNFEADRQGGYTQTDLSLTYSTPNGKYSIQGYVHNLENYLPLNFAEFTGGPPVNIFNFIYGAPRTYGAEVTVKF